MKSRIYLSLAHLGGHEKNYVNKAFEDNWVTTVGPNLKGFEEDLKQQTGAAHVVALSSGTAAIHLGLLGMGVKPGDEVLCSSFTFAASANPIVYCGAHPVFIDSEPGTWNMNPELLEQALHERQQTGKQAKAIVVVHLYGMPARLTELIQIARRYNVPVLEDAAEALGSTYNGQPLGTFGEAGVFSFNGNKIITTSGGGALVTDNEQLATTARFLSTQAKDPAPHYQHSQIGYNYALSNISAGIGRGQMEVLNQRVKRRREIHQFYRNELGSLPGISFQEEEPGMKSNRWLTCILLNEEAGLSPEELRLYLEEVNIETRPLWKPLHLQPVFERAGRYVNGASERLFTQGLCLPSGSGLTDEELARVAAALKSAFKRN